LTIANHFILSIDFLPVRSNYLIGRPCPAVFHFGFCMAVKATPGLVGSFCPSIQDQGEVTMARPTLVLTIVLSMSLTGTASAASWAEALFDDVAHDFGAVPKGATQTFSFALTNKTGEAVHIASVRVGCSCVTASATKTDLKAGESTAVVVRVDTRRLTGPFQKPIFVQFDRPGFEEVRLSIQANIRNDLGVDPESLAFGQVKQGKSSETRVTVLISGLGDYKIREAKCDSSFVQATVRRLPGEADGVSYQITARLRPGLPVGHWYSTVSLTTDHSALPRFQIPVTVEIRSP
jgi:hypothetical protein